jgi:hypothetical protein
LRVHKSDLRPASAPRMGGRRADGGAVKISPDMRLSKTRKFLPHPTFSTCQKIFTVPPRACFPPTPRPPPTATSDIQPACGTPDLATSLSRSQCHMPTGRSASNSHDTRQPQVRRVNSQVTRPTQVAMLHACNIPLASHSLVPSPPGLCGLLSVPRMSGIQLAGRTRTHPNTQESFSQMPTCGHPTPAIGVPFTAMGGARGERPTGMVHLAISIAHAYFATSCLTLSH